MRQQPLPLDYGFAFALYCLMGLTDYFDGYVARARGAVSRLGIFLDPIADKIMIAAVILLLVFTRDIDGWHVIDRKSVRWGKSVSVRVDLGGRLRFKKKTKK